MPMPRHLLAGALAAAIAAAPAAAAPITASEPPDFPRFFLPQFVGTLDIGANTITGGLSFRALDCDERRCDLGRSSDDSDAVSVTLAAGQRITSISATISDFLSSGAPGIRLESDPSSATLPISFFERPQGNGTLQLFTGAADGAGNLDFGFRANPTREGNYAFNYVFTILVEAVPPPPPTTPVPEPATLALFGLGLAGLAAARRRRPA